MELSAVKNVSFGKAKGLLNGKLDFTYSGQLIAVAKQPEALDDKIVLYSGCNENEVIATIDSKFGSLWSEITITSPSDGQIGTGTWEGGPIVSKWKIEDSAKEKTFVSSEDMPKWKYFFKLACYFIPLGFNTAAKTGTMNFRIDNELLGSAVRSGNWFAPKYFIENFDEVSKLFDPRLILSAMALEAIASNRN